MSRRLITLLRFDGPRFADHGLDVDVLPEIVAYKRILQETAKEIWRREHPTRQRLPKQFETSIALKFFQIEPGSTGIPLVHEITSPQFQLLQDELERAAYLLERTIRVADRDNAVPKDLPRAVIPLFEQLGTTLRPEERLLVQVGQELGEPACFDHRVRDNILRWASEPYLDTIEITGEVRATDLDGKRFTLRLPDGRKLAARFKPEQEQIVLEALGEHLKVRINVRGLGEFNGVDESLRQMVSVDEIALIMPAESSPQAVTPIWDRLASIGRAVPEDAWRDVPKDLASNIHAYLYGKKDSQ